MLQGRLSTTITTAALVFAAGCAGADGTDRGAIRENVIEPGITAIDDSSELACNADAAAVRTALDAYELLEGQPAPDEASLVVGEFLREESELWDVIDGELVPVDPACGEVPADLPAADIVTSTEPTGPALDADISAQLDAATPDDILATLTDDEIAEVGGRDCALEVAQVGIAFSRWQFENQATEMTSLTQIADAGYIGSLELWTLNETQLVPVDGTACIGPLDLLVPAG